MVKPIFIISLDVELLWGYVMEPKSKVISMLQNDTRKGRGAVESLLAIFEKYNVPATWAIVGHLFLDHCKKENGIPHKGIPRFKDDWYSEDTCSNIGEAPLYYGRDIVESIISSPVKHEIALHSFSHVPFSECSHEVAEAEVKEGIKTARELGVPLKSFVFPGDNIGHIDVLRENGFRIYRGKELVRLDRSQITWHWITDMVAGRILAPPAQPKWVDGIWEIPSSMPFCDAPFLQFTLLPRARLGIQRAIRSNKVFHIWLHPHNLVAYPSLVKRLDSLLSFVARRRDEDKLQVMTMGELAGYLGDRKEGNNL